MSMTQIISISIILEDQIIFLMDAILAAFVSFVAGSCCSCCAKSRHTHQSPRELAAVTVGKAAVGPSEELSLVWQPHFLLVNPALIPERMPMKRLHLLSNAEEIMREVHPW